MTPCTCSEAAFVGDGGVTRRTQPRTPPSLVSFSRRLAFKTSPKSPSYLIFFDLHSETRHSSFSRSGASSEHCFQTHRPLSRPALENRGYGEAPDRADASDRGTSDG